MQLDDRRRDDVDLDEAERIGICASAFPYRRISLKTKPSYNSLRHYVTSEQAIEA